MALVPPASETSQVGVDAVSCRKRPRVDSELQSFSMPSHPERERKTHRSSSSELDTSPQASAVDQSRSSTSSGSACCEDDNFADQICVSETIKSLEAELGIRADQEASSCSRNEDRLGIYGTIQLLSSTPCSAESELLSWEEDETADSVVDSCSSVYTELPFRDGTILAESFTSDHPQFDFSFHWEMLDDQLGLLRNLSSEHLQALTRYHEEAETICSFQSLAEDAYACTHLDEDIWGLSEAPVYAQDINVR